MIKTLAQLLIERNAQPLVQSLDVPFALLTNFLPKLQILCVSGMQFRSYTLYDTSNKNIFVRQPIHVCIQRPKLTELLRHAVVLNCLANLGILVAIDDHPKLRAPIAQVIISNRRVSQKLERPIQTVADNRA